MKKLAALLLAVLVVLTLCACGSSAKDWQAQYDLGIRCYSDGDYENAIIAFKAAIQIDPRQIEPYSILADIYEQQGDLNAMFDILQQGLDATGSTDLADRIEEEKKEHPDFVPGEDSGEDASSSEAQAGQELSSPETAPELPSPLQFMTAEMCDTAGEPIFTAANYAPTNETAMQALQALIDAGLSGDKETIWQLEPEASVWTPLITGGSTVAASDTCGSLYSFWTVWEDNLLRVRYGTNTYAGKDVGDFVMVDYREKNGTGFMAAMFIGISGDQSYIYAQGKTTDWLLNGNTEYTNHFYDGLDECFREYTQTGTAVNDLPDGPVSITSVYGVTENYTFSAGSCPDWFSDPQAVYYGYRVGRMLG